MKNEFDYLTENEINGVVNSRLYNVIQDYFDNHIYNTICKTNPKDWDLLIDNPLYMYIRLYVLDKDGTSEDDWSNIILKHIFKELHKCAPFINLMYANKVGKNRVDNFCDIKMIIAEGVHNAICYYITNSDNVSHYDELENLFDNNFTIDDFIINLSYSIANDYQWKEYFNIFENYNNKYVYK